MYRIIERFRADSRQELAGDWQEAAEHLSNPGAGVEDTLVWLQRLAGSDAPGPVIYQGVMRPEAVEKVRKARIEADRQAFRLHMLRLDEELQDAQERGCGRGRRSSGASGQATQRRLPFELRKVESDEHPDGFVFEMELDGKPIAPPDNVKGTMASIFQDLGDIPEDYLYAAGDGAYVAEDTGEHECRGRLEGDLSRGRRVSL